MNVHQVFREFRHKSLVRCYVFGFVTLLNRIEGFKAPADVTDLAVEHLRG